MVFGNTFGERIKNLRQAKDMTQKQVGDFIGVSDRIVGYYEDDRFPKDPDILNKIADLFGVTIDFLLCRTDDPYEKTPETKVTEAVADDPELREFWEQLRQREDLQLLFKQVKPLPPSSIAQIMRIIKAIEDEEDVRYNS